MFGLHNYNGSCWVNATLQALFRLPEAQTRYSGADTFDRANSVDASLFTIWDSKGERGLREFFEAVRTETMPAGSDIGDSHELFQYICDKLPFLDEMFRFKIAHSMECKSCKKQTITHESVIEFDLDAVAGKSATLAKCIGKTVEPYGVDEWTCEACKGTGAVRQQLIGTFPQCLMFHAPISNTSIEYSSILVMNKRKYALSSVVCFNGGHWWTYGRDMPPGTSWYNLNDTNIREHGPKQFPVSPQMRMLIYYRVEE